MNNKKFHILFPKQITFCIICSMDKMPIFFLRHPFREKGVQGVYVKS